jgi:TonB family protein
MGGPPVARLWITVFIDRGGIVSPRIAATVLAALILTVVVKPIHVNGQAPSDEIVRRAKTKVQPVYPELAKRMNITGTARIEVMVATNGIVKEAKIVGGHPVLAGAALDAVKKWRFEPAANESSGVIEFKFDAQQ